MKIEVGVMISAIAACISALAALVSIWNYHREQLNQKITAAKWKKEYFADLLKWSDESILLLSEAMHLCDLDPKTMEGNTFSETRHLLRIRLSAQIDRGRWFFPNYATEAHGTHKHGAYRGYRPAVLDGLVSTYRSLSSLSDSDAAKTQTHRANIESAKRLFTTEIQKVLDPSSRDAEFANILGRVRDA